MTAATAERVTVQVTQEHIDRGKRGQCSTCPIALAFLAAVPSIVRVLVRDAVEERADLWFADGEYKPVRVELPDLATDFILDFDDERPVSPFSFDVEVTR